MVMSQPRGAHITAAFISLEAVDISSIFCTRASVMKSVPKFLKLPFKNCMKLALEESLAREEDRQVRGWKLLLMLPRMLLHRKPGGGQISKKQLLDRFDRFHQGQWTSLMILSKDCDERASVGRRRGNRRRQGNNVEERAARAEMLVHMGELSAARQALEGAAVAPGTQATLNALKDPSRRPAHPHDPLPDELTSFVPESRFVFDQDQFCRNLRSSRRGAAGGPSGMTTEQAPSMPLGWPESDATFLRIGIESLWSPGPEGGHPDVAFGSDDSIIEARRWCQGHCRGGRHSQTGCEDDGPAVDTPQWSAPRPPSVCFVHEGGV